MSAHALEEEEEPGPPPHGKDRTKTAKVPISTGSVSADGDSIATESDHEPYDRDNPSKTLTPHISRATTTSGALGITPPTLQRTQTNRSTLTTDPAFEIDFADGEQANPQNWPVWYKGLILFVMSYGTTCVVLYSTSYTSAIPGMQRAFNATQTEGILGVTTYLLGMATGAVILAPLSEMFGRRPIYIIALGMFVVFVIPCAVAQNMATILVTRFFGAFCAAAMISNAPGTVNDITDDEHRALAFSIWSIGPMNGPVIGPVVGGFVYQYLGWRWTNWVVVIVASVAWVVVGLIPETYEPAILRKRAEKKRQETGDERWWSRYDDREALVPLLKVNLARPFTMTFTEPILIFWDIYISLVYGVLYLCFVAYPRVFTDMRGWSPGVSGLAFCGIGVGSMIVICCEPLIRKMINAHKADPESETGDPPPEAMVSVVCIAAVLIPIGEIWFAWTGPPGVHCKSNHYLDGNVSHILTRETRDCAHPRRHPLWHGQLRGLHLRLQLPRLLLRHLRRIRSRGQRRPPLHHGRHNALGRRSHVHYARREVGGHVAGDPRGGLYPDPFHLLSVWVEDKAEV